MLGVDRNKDTVVRADDLEEEVNVGRYLRFVIVFLMIVFAALGAYQYYYGNEAERLQELQQGFQSRADGGEYAAATTTPDGGCVDC